MPLPWLPATFHSFVHVPIAASQEFVVDNYRPSGADDRPAMKRGSAEDGSVLVWELGLLEFSLWRSPW